MLRCTSLGSDDAQRPVGSPLPASDGDDFESSKRRYVAAAPSVPWAALLGRQRFSQRHEPHLVVENAAQRNFRFLRCVYTEDRHVRISEITQLYRSAEFFP
jgi:hypothetical protein